MKIKKHVIQSLSFEDMAYLIGGPTSGSYYVASFTILKLLEQGFLFWDINEKKLKDNNIDKSALSFLERRIINGLDDNGSIEQIVSLCFGEIENIRENMNIHIWHWKNWYFYIYILFLMGLLYVFIHMLMLDRPLSLVEIIAFIFSLKFFKNLYVIDIISKDDAAIQSKIHLQNMPNKPLAISYLLYQANALTDSNYEGLNDFLCSAYKMDYDDYRDRSVD